MGIAQRLDLRQSQSLVMTAQLQQAIKLLALSNLEVETFIGEAIAANPLLELGDASGEAATDGTADAVQPAPRQGEPGLQTANDLAGNRSAPDWGGQLDHRGAEDYLALAERACATPSLAEHLSHQIGASARDPALAALARHIVGLLDDAGYLAPSIAEVSRELGVPIGDADAALALVQSLDPTGVGARSLGECIALQAREADRYDPAMAALIDNLDLVARGEIARIRRLCGVDDEDLAEMLAELRRYDPKPGLRFAGGTAEAVTPDVLVTARADGGWDIALNQATLPRPIVNRAYYVEMRGACADRSAKSWLSDKLADANWLVKALDQRQKTILKVSAEIVSQQEGFFRHGVSRLKPLTLRTVAEAIGMHESTVSRVTSNKYLLCDRGAFELKYFFTSGVAAAGGEGAVSAATVKASIRRLTDAERPCAVLSDDALVDLLRGQGFDLARRTVAKYREAIGVGSSVQRRRQKALAMVG